MRFSVGCLTGIVVGILLVVGGYFGYTFLFSSANLPLVPAPSSGDADLTITVGEAYLNEQVQQEATAQGLNLTDLAIQLHAPNRADASMSLGVRVLNQAFSVRPTASLHFGVTNGSIVLTLDQVSIAGFSVPQNLVNQQLGQVVQMAQNEINAEASQALANSGLRIIGVDATDSTLIIKLAR